MLVFTNNWRILLELIQKARFSNFRFKSRFKMRAFRIEQVKRYLRNAEAQVYVVGTREPYFPSSFQMRCRIYYVSITSLSKSAFKTSSSTKLLVPSSVKAQQLSVSYSFLFFSNQTKVGSPSILLSKRHLQDQLE